MAQSCQSQTRRLTLNPNQHPAMKPTDTPTAQIVTFDFQNHAIPFTTDAHVNLTEMCAAFGKRALHFLQLESTQRFLVALAADTGLSLESDDGNPVITSGLLVTIRGRFANGQQQGTWAHPDLALECARWLSPEFAIWTNRAIRKLLSGECLHSAQDERALARLECKLKELNAETAHLRRRMMRLTKVEGTVSLWAYLEAAQLHFPADKILRMRVSRAARDLCLSAGLPMGAVKQLQSRHTNSRAMNTNKTFPPHILYRVLCTMGYDHTQPPLTLIMHVWQPMLPLASRTAA